jgi:hypothetical protein
LFCRIGAKPFQIIRIRVPVCFAAPRSLGSGLEFWFFACDLACCEFKLTSTNLCQPLPIFKHSGFDCKPAPSPDVTVTSCSTSASSSWLLHSLFAPHFATTFAFYNILAWFVANLRVVPEWAGSPASVQPIRFWRCRSASPSRPAESGGPMIAAGAPILPTFRHHRTG